MLSGRWSSAVGSGLGRVINTLDGSTSMNPDRTTSTTITLTDANNYMIAAPTGAATLSLGVSCTVISGKTKTIVNNSAFAITVSAINSEPIIGTTTIAAATTMTYTATPGAPATGGCSWVAK